MAVKITTVDHGLAALLKRCDKADKILTVGIHEDAGAAGDGDATVSDIAAINEFGLGVPERSFIRAWAEENEEKHQGDLTKLGKAIVKGAVKDAEHGLGQLAQKYVGEVQARIAGGIAPENAQATKDRKHSSTPLIDTGVLRSSIAGRVQ